MQQYKRKLEQNLKDKELQPDEREIKPLDAKIDKILQQAPYEILKI